MWVYGVCVDRFSELGRFTKARRGECFKEGLVNCEDCKGSHWLRTEKRF